MHCFTKLTSVFSIAIAVALFATPAAADEWDELLGPEQLAKITAAVPAKAAAKPAAPRKVLVFTESKQDFDRLATATRQKHVPHASAPYAAKVVALSGEKTGTFTARIESNPGVFKENLSQFDAIVLANVFLEGKLFQTPRDFTQEQENRFTEPQKVLVDYVKGGGGLVGIHLAAAEAPAWPELNEMLGGTYGGQAWQAFHKTPVKLDDAKSPLTAAFGGQAFTVEDDIYMFHGPSPRETCARTPECRYRQDAQEHVGRQAGRRLPA